MTATALYATSRPEVLASSASHSASTWRERRGEAAAQRVCVFACVFAKLALRAPSCAGAPALRRRSAPAGSCRRRRRAPRQRRETRRCDSQTMAALAAACVRVQQRTAQRVPGFGDAHGVRRLQRGGRRRRGGGGGRARSGAAAQAAARAARRRLQLHRRSRPQQPSVTAPASASEQAMRGKAARCGNDASERRCTLAQSQILLCMLTPALLTTQQAYGA